MPLLVRTVAGLARDAGERKLTGFAIVSGRMTSIALARPIGILYFDLEDWIEDGASVTCAGPRLVFFQVAVATVLGAWVITGNCQRICLNWRD